MWLALSWGSHPNSSVAWDWYRTLRAEEVQFCRLTQIGLLRLLTTRGVMGNDCLTLRGAWKVYDQWLGDPKVELRREPADVDLVFRRAASRFANLAAPKALGDCYLLALAQASGASLVTFDTALAGHARRIQLPVVLLG